MFLFAKPVYKTVDMPFFLIEAKEDFEAGIIGIEAAGVVDNVTKYFYAAYSLKKASLYDDGSYENILENIKSAQGMEIPVVLKYRKNKLKSFKIDVESLTFACGYDRLKYLELLGWGINDFSAKEKIESEKA